jgi:hypothetical protein
MGQKWGKCGGVNEDQIGIFGVVRYWEIRGYKRFSMADTSAFTLSLLLAYSYGILGGWVWDFSLSSRIVGYLRIVLDTTSRIHGSDLTISYSYSRTVGIKIKDQI